MHWWKYNDCALPQLKDPTKVDANNDIKFLIIVIEYPTFKKLNAGNYFKLLNLDLAKMLISNLNLKDLNEVYWRDIQVYLKIISLGCFWNCKNQKIMAVIFEMFYYRKMNILKKSES